MTYAKQYIEEAVLILNELDQSAVERTAELLLELRKRSGRLFLLGVGGGAGHASHAVCDFRKITQIEAYAPSDNVSELTARVNDEGWDTCYANWLRGSRLNEADMVFVFSVGGGDAKKNISANLVRALEYAREVSRHHLWRRRPRRRLHCSGRGRLRTYSGRQFVDHNSAHGIVSGDDLASLGFAPETQNR